MVVMFGVLLRVISPLQGDDSEAWLKMSHRYDMLRFASFWFSVDTLSQLLAMPAIEAPYAVLW